jgi:type IV secretory pathway TrbD component
MQADPAATELHPIHGSLFRPVLFAGAEPAAAALEVLTAGALLFGAGFHVATVCLAAFYLTVVHALMVWVAKHDPHMSQLYLRSLRARDFYEPLGAIHSAVVPARPSIPSGGR